MYDRMTRLSLRFLIPLLIVLAGIGYALLPLVDRLALRWSSGDADYRAKVMSTPILETLAASLVAKDRYAAQRFLDRVVKNEGLVALAVCDGRLEPVYTSKNFPPEVRCGFGRPTPDKGIVVEKGANIYHLMSFPIQKTGAISLGQLLLVQDLSSVRGRTGAVKKYIFYLFLFLGIAVSWITVLIAQLSWRGWVSGMKAMLKGEGIWRPLSRPTAPELKPILKDLRTLVKDLESDRQLRDEGQVSWTPKTLKEILRSELRGEEILVVSNRQPYVHVTKPDNSIEVQNPASGLVTALEPIMRACSGTWIAHGSGSGDKAVVDKQDHIAVPPGAPAYRIRRVWLTPEEEEGYYYGLANEGLWPLCHIAHTRPIFRSQDWREYSKVNGRFARAVWEEAKSEDPVVLVQDYHFALLPGMIRRHLPKATIMTFWHIPWPNPEAFGICPWREELLEGLLGSTTVGFHTRFHCNNFLDTVDRFLECRIDRENSTISYKGKLTAVRQYPISIEWPPKWLRSQPSVIDCRARIRRRHQLPADCRVGIGVDRLDYTKGIVERFMAVERMLELFPQWRGKFSFIQIAAPSRTKIERYQQLDQEVEGLAARINQRFTKNGVKPITLIVEHREPEQVFEYFRGADVCVVSSLHDGMNLVAKEFVASRDDEFGVLILSQFTGASRELPEALTINPYNIDQCAEALHASLEMSPPEQRERMRSMRGVVKEFNIYRWAGRMLMDAARIRQRNRLVERVAELDFVENRAFPI